MCHVGDNDIMILKWCSGLIMILIWCSGFIMILIWCLGYQSSSGELTPATLKESYKLTNVLYREISSTLFLYSDMCMPYLKQWMFGVDVSLFAWCEHGLSSKDSVKLNELFIWTAFSSIFVDVSNYFVIRPSVAVDIRFDWFPCMSVFVDVFDLVPALDCVCWCVWLAICWF